MRAVANAWLARSGLHFEAHAIAANSTMKQTRQRDGARRLLCPSSVLLLEVRARSRHLWNVARRDSAFPLEAYRAAVHLDLRRCLERDAVREAVVLVACAAEFALPLAPLLLERCASKVAISRDPALRSLYWASTRRLHQAGRTPLPWRDGMPAG